MDSDRNRRASEISLAAASLSEEKREAFLVQSCGDDRDLLKEATRLLRLGLVGTGSTSHDEAGSPSSFLPELLEGQKVGHYRILRPLGKGGMGEVYLAEDSKLERHVALKVLPSDLAANEERLARFQREIKILASLSHNNIVTVHSVDEIDGLHFFTMELVSGESLAESLAGGPLPLDQLLEISIALSDALCAAHELNIIHRDLKPGNVMIDEDGAVKVLDFGLAKLGRGVEPHDLRELPTEPLTAEGRIIGTMPYMSPEQLEGRATIDARSDIFSLGVILYEMATGERPFKGDSSISLISSIVKETPRDIRELRTDLPNNLARIVSRCLNKTPDRRYQSAKDLWNDLEDLRRETASGESVTPSRRTSSSAKWVLLAVVGVVVFAAFLTWPDWFSKTGIESADVDQYREMRLTANPEDLWARGVLSPDGRMLAFRDPLGVYVQDIELGQVKTISNEEAFLGELRWHPDGRSLLLTETTGPESSVIWQVSLLTGEKSLIQENARLAQISPDARWIAFVPWTGDELWVRSYDDASSRILVSVPLDNHIQDFSWSPTGTRLAYLQEDLSGPKFGAVIKTVSLAGGEPQELLSEPRLVLLNGARGGIFWLLTGDLLYVLRGKTGDSPGSSLWSLAVEEETGRQIGPPRMIEYWAEYMIVSPSGSSDGRRIGITKMQFNWDVYVGELSSETEKIPELHRITNHLSTDWPIDWLADDELLIYSDRFGQGQIFRQGLDRESSPVAINVQGLEKASPLALSPDKEWLFLVEHRRSGDGDTDSLRLLRLATKGGAGEPVYEVPISEDGVIDIALDCPSVIGRPCVLGERVGDTLVFSEFDPLAGKGTELASLEIEDYDFSEDWGISPTGSKVVLPLAETTIGILDLADKSMLEIELETSLDSLCWSRDETSIIVTGRAKRQFVVGEVSLDGFVRELWTSHSTLFLAHKTSPDGRHVALWGYQDRRDVWLLCSDCPGD